MSYYNEHIFTNVVARCKLDPVYLLYRKQPSSFISLPAKGEAKRANKTALIDHLLRQVHFPFKRNFLLQKLFSRFSALTLEDEIRSIGQLIIGFIRTVSFGRDFEQQLSFYVEARSSFSNIDQTIMYLVQVCI